MKKPSLAEVLAPALAPFPASAAPDPALEPLAFLAGHCWIGTIPGTADTDEHCFTWVYEDRYLRDRHVVRRGEKAVYEGESIYYWNSVAKQVEYFYITAAGGHPQGKMVTAGDGRRAGDDAYEVLREPAALKERLPEDQYRGRRRTDGTPSDVGKEPLRHSGNLGEIYRKQRHHRHAVRPRLLDDHHANRERLVGPE